jgi:farnesyl-diphosphate farnesyltransferase
LAFLRRFSSALAGHGDAQSLARELEQRLSDRTLAAERDLVSNMERVLTSLARLNESQQTAIQRCVELMCLGMPHFQFSASLKGLARSSDLDDYCYYVAGVVGEMLTELFCDYSPEIARRRPALSAVAASFAQGLQMTNILKDVWEDRSRGACWLPQEVFTRHGVDLGQLSSEPFDPRFGEAYRELVGVAHAHLRNALEYTLMIPSKEIGIRRFCLWAIGLAVLTLRKIERNPRFTAGAQVKITRTAVAMTRLLTNAAGRSDLVLRLLFRQAARGLPLARLTELRRPRQVPAPIKLDQESVRDSQQEFRRSYGNSGS